MSTEFNQTFPVTDCDTPSCRICLPDEDFTNYDDFAGYSMTNHSEECYE